MEQKVITPPNTGALVSGSIGHLRRIGVWIVRRCRLAQLGDSVVIRGDEDPAVELLHLSPGAELVLERGQVLTIIGPGKITAATKDGGNGAAVSQVAFHGE